MTSQFQLITVALFLILVNKVTSQTDSTTFNFTTFYTISRDLTYQGDAHVPLGSTNVRLVRMISIYPSVPAQNSAGRVLYSQPVSFWVPGRQASFETTFTFTVRTITGSPTGDGLTFFIAPVNSSIPTGSYGGNFGIFNPLTGLAPSIFAFEYDYYYEGEDASWDPRYWHIGIDINSRVSKNTTGFFTLGGVYAMTATVNYDASTRTITAMTNRSSETKSVSYVIDLKTILPQQVQVGISGSTGVGVSIPELHSWSFTSALVGDSTNNIEDTAENEEEYAKQYV